jgi:outer membrane protein assembly factor BamB
VAPEDERIVAFGQVESPWPAAGSVLVVGDTAYVAAGRHPLAYGGIRILALDTATGAVKWVSTINSDIYNREKTGQGLDVDIFDLLVGEARRPSTPAAGDSKRAGDEPDYITMGRWQLDPTSGELGCDWPQGFYYARTGGAGVMAPRGLWTYGERMTKGATSTPRPLAAFRDGAIFTSTADHADFCRVDFTPEKVAAFGGSWHSHRQEEWKPRSSDKRVLRGRREPDRVAYYLLREHEEEGKNNATWMAADVFGPDSGLRYVSPKGIAAVVLAGDTVFVAGKKGRLLAYAAADGKKLAERDLPPPVWDGMAAANGCLYVSTANGKVLALGRK